METKVFTVKISGGGEFFYRAEVNCDGKYVTRVQATHGWILKYRVWSVCRVHTPRGYRTVIEWE